MPGQRLYFFTTMGLTIDVHACVRTLSAGAGKVFIFEAAVMYEIIKMFVLGGSTF